jgi:hypothetical protein
VLTVRTVGKPVQKISTQVVRGSREGASIPFVASAANPPAQRPRSRTCTKTSRCANPTNGFAPRYINERLARRRINRDGKPPHDHGGPTRGHRNRPTIPPPADAVAMKPLPYVYAVHTA